MNLNRATLIGRVGQDPKITYLQNGRCMARLSLATSEMFVYKDGSRKQHTEWHTVVFFGPRAEVAEKYIRKGMLLYVEGPIRYRSYEDKEGVQRFTCEILASDFRFLEPRKENEREGAAEAPNHPDDGYLPTEPEDDGLPF